MSLQDYTEYQLIDEVKIRLSQIQDEIKWLKDKNHYSAWHDPMDECADPFTRILYLNKKGEIREGVFSNNRTILDDGKVIYLVDVYKWCYHPYSSV